MAANYAKISKVDAGFQQVPLLQNFWNVNNIVMEHQLFKITEEKQNTFSNIIFFPEIHLQ